MSKFERRLADAIDVFVAASDPDGAHEVFRECLREQPDNPEVLFWLARSYSFNKADSERAAELLMRALEADPSRAECKSMLVSVLLDMERPLQELLSMAREVVSERPDWIIPRQQLATLYDMAGDEKAANEEIEAVVCLMRKHRESGRFRKYSYYEACITGRHVTAKAEHEYLNRVEWVRANRPEAQHRCARASDPFVAQLRARLRVQPE